MRCSASMAIGPASGGAFIEVASDMRPAKGKLHIIAFGERRGTPGLIARRNGFDCICESNLSEGLPRRFEPMSDGHIKVFG